MKTETLDEEFENKQEYTREQLLEMPIDELNKLVSPEQLAEIQADALEFKEIMDTISQLTAGGKEGEFARFMEANRDNFDAINARLAPIQEAADKLKVKVDKYTKIVGSVGGIIYVAAIATFCGLVFQTATGGTFKDVLPHMLRWWVNTVSTFEDWALTPDPSALPLVNELRTALGAFGMVIGLTAPAALTFLPVGVLSLAHASAQKKVGDEDVLQENSEVTGSRNSVTEAMVRSGATDNSKDGIDATVEGARGIIDYAKASMERDLLLKKNRDASQ